MKANEKKHTQHLNVTSVYTYIMHYIISVSNKQYTIILSISFNSTSLFANTTTSCVFLKLVLV